MDRLRKLLDLLFQLPDQRIVRLDLPVQLAPFCDGTSFFHGPCSYTLMNRRLFLQTALMMTTMIQTLLMSGTLQMTVCHIRPGRPP